MLEQKDADLASSENSSSESATEEKQQQQQQQPARYRKRAGSKRVEANTNCGLLPPDNNIMNKENIDSRRKRAGSKNVNRLSITILPEYNNEPEQKLSVFLLPARASTATLQMNGKDIYSGTWNPKERAVLDQVLNNMEGGDGTKGDQKKSFISLFKRGGKSSSSSSSSSLPSSPSPKSNKEKQIDKIIEDLEEELAATKTASTDNNKADTKYPLSQYYKSDAEKHQQKRHNNNNNNNKFGIFRKFKESVKQRHEEALLDRQLQHYLPSPNIKKRGIFGRFHSKNKNKNENGGGVTTGRSRAHSSNDYARSIGVYVQPENESEENKNKNVLSTRPESSKSNLSKKKSGSFRNLFSSSSSRAKSMDNLNGAFEYYANPKQVFQRTPSMSKLNSRSVSMEKLDHHQHQQMKRSASQKLLNRHAFEPVQMTAKELCYEENPMTCAQARFVQQQEPQQQQSSPPSFYNTNTNNHGQQRYHLPAPLRQQPQSDGYCSAYEDDLYRGYQSDISPAMHHQYHHNHPRYSQRFTFDQQLAPSHYQQHQQRGYSSSDVECNNRSASGSISYRSQQQQARYYTPQPQHHFHSTNNNHYTGAGNINFFQNTPAQAQPPPQPPMSPYFLPPQQAPPLPGFYTPGYATPGAVFPHSGYETPNGYASESDYGYYAHAQYSPSFQRPQQQQSGYMAYQSRRAVQRSLSKNSSNSNYSSNFGYASESSFCDDEVYSMVQPPPQGFSPRQLSSSASTEHYKNSCSPGTKKTAIANHYQLTTEV